MSDSDAYHSGRLSGYLLLPRFDYCQTIILPTYEQKLLHVDGLLPWVRISPDKNLIPRLDSVRMWLHF